MRAISWLVVTLVMLLGTVTRAQTTEPVIAGGQIIASGFNYPQGVLVDADGSVWVIEAGLGDGDLTPMAYGMTARVVKITPAGEQIEIARLPSLAVTEDDILGGARLAFLDGILYATVGGWRDDLDGERPPLMGALVKIADGAVTEVADLWAYEAAHNPDGLALNARPYGLAAGPDGWLWIADSGGNSILRVNPQTGDIQTVTAFTGQSPTVSPTGIAFGADGLANGALLSYSSLDDTYGYGTFNVFGLSADGTISNQKMSLTDLYDLSLGPDGKLYAVRFNKYEGPESGMIVRVTGVAVPEELVSDLPFPTSIDFDAEGNAYVAMRATGEIVRIEKLTELHGTFGLPWTPNNCGCG